MFWNSGKNDNKKKGSKPEDYCNEHVSLKTAIEKDCTVEGRLSYQNPVKIDGKLEGDFHSSADVVVGPNAYINAGVSCDNITVYGKVSGNITASGSVKIVPGGQVEGNISCKSMSFDNNALFNGSCKMSSQSDA